MSDENVEIVRRHIDAYRSGQWARALAAYHPEVICDTTALPEGRIYRGREGVSQSGRGKASGVHVVQQTVWIYRLREGQIVHATVMVDRERALDAAGLRE